MGISIDGAGGAAIGSAAGSIVAGLQTAQADESVDVAALFGSLGLGANADAFA